MENDTFTTTQEWEQHLGSGIRELRKRKQLTQADLAASANVSLSSIKRLEEGDGSSMSTVIRVVRALERKEWLSQLVPPAPSISPLAIYRASQQSTSKKRSRRSRPQVSGTSPVSYVTVHAIQVSAWDRVVGALALDPQTNFYAFEYDEAWIETGVELAPLHLANQRGVFVFADLARATYYGLPAMVADALPDRFGNALVNAWMADQGITEQQITPLDRLAYAGNRTMGALSFEPSAVSAPEKPSMVQVATLVTAARAQIAGTLDRDGVNDALSQLITVGSTAGGARAKAVVAYKPSTGEMLSGQLDAPRGYEQWLLKLDGVGDPTGQSDAVVSSEQYCRVEYAYYLMATSAGIEMAESQLLPEGPRAHFLTKRFDRGPENERIHVQSLCALAHLDYRLAKTHSCASWFITARQLGLRDAEANQIFRRIAFNVLSVNRDDHTKNVAFLRREHGPWELTPAYDVTHSHWTGDWTQGQQMSVNGKFEHILLDDLREVGDRFEVPAIEQSLADVLEAVSAWPEFAASASVDAGTTARITDDIAAATRN